MNALQPRLPYGRQTVDEDDILAVVDVLRSPWLTCGPVVEQFEDALAGAVGAAHAVACSSGTAALHLACRALGLGPGDAAVVPAITFIATANAARYCGAEVVLADVDAQTGMLTEQSLRAAVARARLGGLRPKVVLPVHLNGQVCEMPAIAAAARELDLTVIDDACHAVGSEYSDSTGKSVRVGACQHAAATVFSFHPVKTLTMGEGGAITTADPVLAARLRALRNHAAVREPAAFENTDLAFDANGRTNPWYVEFQDLGHNYRATDIACALGLSQLRKFDHFVAARRGLAGCYQERLASLGGVVAPIGRAPSCSPAWHLAVAMIDFAAAGIGRGDVMRYLAACGIGSQVHYVPLHLQPCFRHRYGAQSLHGAEAYYARCLSLPLFPAMTATDVDRVVDVLASCLHLEEAA